MFPITGACVRRAETKLLRNRGCILQQKPLFILSYSVWIQTFSPEGFHYWQKHRCGSSLNEHRKASLLV